MTEEKENKVTQRITSKQKTFLDLFKKASGNISIACEKTGISRGTYYNWINDNPRFKEKVDEVNESLIDFSESKLHLKINEGDTTAIIFHLKTKGKQRGYVERVENEMPQLNPFLQLMMEASKEDEK